MSYVDEHIAMLERAGQEYAREYARCRNYEEIYAKYDNYIRTASDADDPKEKVDFWKEVRRYAELGMIETCMQNAGYYRNNNDDWNRWTR